MSLQVVFRRTARTEFDEAADWYENQKEGLGNDFVSTVELVLNTIAEQPDRYPVILGDVREALLSRFPFGVYYRLKPYQIVIIAVFHASRDPSVLRGRK